MICWMGPSRLLTVKTATVLFAATTPQFLSRSAIAIANGYGWTRFLHAVDQVFSRRGDTLLLPLGEPVEMEETAN
jgi:hypothetical protein